MTTTSVTDPVCGMHVEATASTAKSEYGGQTYHFCCSGCKSKFDKSPDQYVGASASVARADKSGCCCG